MRDWHSWLVAVLGENLMLWSENCRSYHFVFAILMMVYFKLSLGNSSIWSRSCFNFDHFKKDSTLVKLEKNGISPVYSTASVKSLLVVVWRLVLRIIIGFQSYGAYILHQCFVDSVLLGYLPALPWLLNTQMIYFLVVHFRCLAANDHIISVKLTSFNVKTPSLNDHFRMFLSFTLITGNMYQPLSF